MERKLQHKDKLTWHAHMLTFIFCLSNGTSSLAVTCPGKNQEVWPFWCPYINVDFSGLNRAQDHQLQKANDQN